MTNLSNHVSMLSLVVFGLPFLTAAQTGKVYDLKSKVDDLVFRVEDMGGKVQVLTVKESPVEVRIDLAADVLFDFDKAEILPKAQQTLAQAAQIVRERAKGVVRIEGYTDAKGSDSYNLKLSERRAMSVKDWFVEQQHLREVRFATQGFGAKNPVAPNSKPDGSDDPEGRQKNRRVEIIFRK
ncbi:MAG: OmpA family protein [Candidatus Sulfopaludibacter sp.]|nr:OmpA family protein [Candidatus Sulfopaludibacter sp.]